MKHFIHIVNLIAFVFILYNLNDIWLILDIIIIIIIKNV
jgi:hypothetical protein